VSNHLDQRAGKEHPGLRSVDSDVVEDRLELRPNELRRQFVHSRDAGHVLRSQRGDRGHAVAARGRERLQVGLNACAAARIRAGDGQTTWNRDSSLPSPVRTGSGSTGVISAPKGTPVTPGYHRRMAVEAALWDDLLEGEEVAHVTTLASAQAQTVPLPDDLEPRLHEALPISELYLHQRAAWDAARRGEHV